MKWFIIAGLAAVTAIVVGSLALPRPAASQTEGGCWITGGGYIEMDDGQGASFGGNAMGMRDGSVRGQWQHTTHSGDVLHGQIEWVRCWSDGGGGPGVPKAIPNSAEWGGHGQWNGMEGYNFLIRAHDRAEGGVGSDYYSIQVTEPFGPVVYEADAPISGGNMQIHPANRGHPY